MLEDTHGKLGHDEVHGDVFGDVFGDSSGDFAIADSHPGREVWPVHSSKDFEAIQTPAKSWLDILQGHLRSGHQVSLLQMEGLLFFYNSFYTFLKWWRVSHESLCISYN